MRVGPDDGDALDILRKRQQVVFIFEQHDGLSCRLPGQLPLLGRFKHQLHAVGCDVDVVKEAELKLELEVPPDRLVDYGFGNQPFPHRREQVLPVALDRGALHVKARGQGHHRRLAQVTGDALVLVQQADGEIIGDDDPLKAQLAPEDAGEQLPRRRTGDAVDGMIGVHHRTGPSHADGRFVREDVHLPQLAGGEVHRRVVFPALGSPVAGEVLEGRRDAFAKVVSLQAPDIRRDHPGHKVGIFAECLLDTAPAEIPGHVHHRRKAQVGADGPHLLADLRRHPFHQLRLKGARHPDGLGISRRARGHKAAEAFLVNQSGNAKARLVEEKPLHLVGRLRRLPRKQPARPGDAGDLPDAVGHDPSSFLHVQVAVFVQNLLGTNRAQLRDLFFQGHPRQQILDSRFDRRVLLFVQGQGHRCIPRSPDMMFHGKRLLLSYYSSFYRDFPVSV